MRWGRSTRKFSARPAVRDIVCVPATPDLWEIRFQRGIAVETDVQIEFQGNEPAGVSATGRSTGSLPVIPGERGQAGRATIATPEFVGVRQAAQVVAIRSGGRIELDAATRPRGWVRSDWSAAAC